ncbi:hypothetical protein DIPPA_34958 [Diplonema papillatum]|nr:hypothetical protein DIPPA_34958 [Diplonema papillatum]
MTDSASDNTSLMGCSNEESPGPDDDDVIFSGGFLNFLRTARDKLIGATLERKRVLDFAAPAVHIEFEDVCKRDVFQILLDVCSRAALLGDDDRSSPQCIPRHSKEKAQPDSENVLVLSNENVRLSARVGELERDLKNLRAHAAALQGQVARRQQQLAEQRTAFLRQLTQKHLQTAGRDAYAKSEPISFVWDADAETKPDPHEEQDQDDRDKLTPDKTIQQLRDKSEKERHMAELRRQEESVQLKRAFDTIEKGINQYLHKLGEEGVAPCTVLPSVTLSESGEATFSERVEPTVIRAASLAEVNDDETRHRAPPVPIGVPGAGADLCVQTDVIVCADAATNTDALKFSPQDLAEAHSKTDLASDEKRPESRAGDKQGHHLDDTESSSAEGSGPTNSSAESGRKSSVAAAETRNSGFRLKKPASGKGKGPRSGAHETGRDDVPSPDTRAQHPRKKFHVHRSTTSDELMKQKKLVSKLKSELASKDVTLSQLLTDIDTFKLAAQGRVLRQNDTCSEDIPGDTAERLEKYVSLKETTKGLQDNCDNVTQSKVINPLKHQDSTVGTQHLFSSTQEAENHDIPIDGDEAATKQATRAHSQENLSQQLREKQKEVQVLKQKFEDLHAAIDFNYNSVNFKAISKLRHAVQEAERSEEMYRVSGWSLLALGTRFSTLLSNTVCELREDIAGHRHSTMTVRKLQTAVQVMEHRFVLMMAGQRHNRTHLKELSNRSWDRVLYYARSLVRSDEPQDLPSFSTRPTSALHQQDWGTARLHTTVFPAASPKGLTLRSSERPSSAPVTHIVDAKDCSTIKPKSPPPCLQPNPPVAGITRCTPGGASQKQRVSSLKYAETMEHQQRRDKILAMLYKDRRMQAEQLIRDRQLKVHSAIEPVFSDAARILRLVGHRES